MLTIGQTFIGFVLSFICARIVVFIGRQVKKREHESH